MEVATTPPYPWTLTEDPTPGEGGTHKFFTSKWAQKMNRQLPRSLRPHWFKSFDNFCCFIASCMIFFDRKLNLLTEEILNPENKDFLDSINTLTEKTLYLLMIPGEWHKKLRSSAYTGTCKAWDVLLKVCKLTWCLLFLSCSLNVVCLFS